MSTGMSLLEARYRRVLRLLPASYRAEREEEMVAAYLDALGDLSEEDAEDLRPSWSEVLSVAALAVRVRFGGAGAPPRPVALGAAVRLAALLGLGAHAALSVVALGSFLNLFGALGPPPELGVDHDLAVGPAWSATRLEHLVGALAGLAWTAAYVTLVRGHRRAAKTLALLALTPDLYRLGADTAAAVGGGAGGWERPWTALAGALLAIVPVLALLAGFHRDAPPVRHATWLAPLPVGAGAVLGIALAALAASARPGSMGLLLWTDTVGLLCLLLVAAGVTSLWAHARTPARRTPSWPLALALLAVPVLATRLDLLRLSAPQLSSADPAGPEVVAVLAGQTAAVGLVAVALLVLGVRMLRRLPPAPAAGAPPARS